MSTDDTTPAGVCVHGGLRRQCEPCTLAVELEDAETELVGLTTRLREVKQDRDAQYAHNTALIERITELEQDNEMYGDVLARLTGRLNGTGSADTINWNLIEQTTQILGELHTLLGLATAQLHKMVADGPKKT